MEHNEFRANHNKKDKKKLHFVNSTKRIKQYIKQYYYILTNSKVSTKGSRNNTIITTCWLIAYLLCSGFGVVGMRGDCLAALVSEPQFSTLLFNGGVSGIVFMRLIAENNTNTKITS